MSASVPKVWGKLYGATRTADVAYAALASLATLPPPVVRLEWSVVELHGSTPTCRLYGQRISDDRWVPIGDSLLPDASGAESSGVIDLPAGQYDNLAFVLSGTGATGVALEILGEHDAEAQ